MDARQLQDLIAAIQRSNGKSLLDYAIALASLAVSIAAVIIGVRISRRLSLKNQMLQKQIETVFRLIESIQDQAVVVAVREQDGPRGGWLCETSLLDLLSIDQREEHLHKALMYKAPFYFTWDAYESLGFLKFARNPYTPKPIADVICQFRYRGEEDWVNMVHDDDLVERAMLLPLRRDNVPVREEPKPWYVREKRIHKDFATFVAVVGELVEAMSAWLRTYEADELNIRRADGTLVHTGQPDHATPARRPAAS